ADGDGDGFGVTSDVIYSCSQPDGYVFEPGDCDDNNAAVNPLASEVCNGYDDNCDGAADNDAVDVSTWYADSDNDGYGDAGVAQLACDQPTGYVNNSDDCDDVNPNAYPSADEYCNGVDDNCNGETDEYGLD